MDIILWRHAEAHNPREGQDDLSRTLTAKGERQAQRMAEWLNQRMAHSTRIFVSPLHYPHGYRVVVRHGTYRRHGHFVLVRADSTRAVSVRIVPR